MTLLAVTLLGFTFEVRDAIPVVAAIAVVIVAAGYLLTRLRR